MPPSPCQGGLRSGGWALGSLSSGTAQETDEGGAEIKRHREGVLRERPTARPEPGSAAPGPASSPASLACGAAVRGKIAGGGAGRGRGVASSKRTGALALVSPEAGGVEGGAGCLLTSSSFSRISFSVSARGNMGSTGSGISVVLRRESLLGGKEKEQESRAGPWLYGSRPPGRAWKGVGLEEVDSCP